jgi:hypothetical protein
MSRSYSLTTALAPASTAMPLICPSPATLPGPLMPPRSRPPASVLTRPAGVSLRISPETATKTLPALSAASATIERKPAALPAPSGGNAVNDFHVTPPATNTAAPPWIFHIFCAVPAVATYGTPLLSTASAETEETSAVVKYLFSSSQRPLQSPGESRVTRLR